MKTVQYWLNNVDETELINAYIDKYEDDFAFILKRKTEYSNYTVAEIIDRHENKLKEYLNRLRTLEPVVSDDYVLIAYKFTEDGYGGITSALFNIAELKEKQVGSDSYGYEFNTQAEIMGYLVADTKYTRKHIIDLLIDVMYEASFFGYEQEKLEETLQELKDVEKEFEEGKGRTFSFDEFKEALGIFDEEEDLKEEELNDAIFKAVGRYNGYCREKEILEFLSTL